NDLFGHEAGAFTGAASSSVGLIHEAEGGTVFLDEIDELPLLAQVKLLRLLQEKEYRRLGAHKSCKADIRVLAATNRNLHETLTTGRLRVDLYYRLNTVTLCLPALRDRLEDVPLLACNFLKKLAVEYAKPCKDLHASAVHRLISYGWPGNVRELENVMARSVLLSDENTLYAAQILLPESPTNSNGASFREQKARVVAQFERSYIAALLAASGGNISWAAKSAQKN